MGTHVSNISGRFAKKSKQPGDRQDYRVLTSSTGHPDKSSFESIFSELNTGEMPDREGAEWVAAGASASGAEDYATIIYQRWTPYVDKVNRRILAQYALTVPYRELQELAPGYCDLLEQLLPNLAAYERDGPPLALRPGSVLDRLETYATLLETLPGSSYQLAAGIAAALLESPVAITGADLPDIETRLAYLDAIACLLPYGCRASLSISTDSLPASRHSVRLVFAAAAKQGKQLRASFGRGKVEPGLDPAPGPKSQAYYEMLIRLRQDHALIKILQHLAASRERLPIEPGNLDKILAVLEHLDQPRIIYGKVKARTANLAEVRGLFSSGAAGVLATEQRSEMLLFMLRHSDLTQQDLAVLAQHWDQIPRRQLSDVCAELLSEANDKTRPLLNALGHELSRQGRGRAFIDLLIELSARLKSARSDAAIASALRNLLVAQAIAEGGVASERHLEWPVSLDPTWRKLQANRALLSIFILAVLKLDEDVIQRSMLEAMERAIPQAQYDLLIFRVAGGFAAQILEPAHVEALLAGGIDPLPELVTIAAKRDQGAAAQRMIPAIAFWLAKHAAELTEDTLGAWRMILGTLLIVTPEHVQLQSALDFMTVLLQDAPKPQYLKARLGSKSSDEYSDVMVNLIGVLSGQRRLDLVGMLAGLVARSATKSSAANGMELLKRLAGLLSDEPGEQTAGFALSRVYDAMMELASLNPALIDEPDFLDKWESRLAKKGYGLRLRVVRLRQLLRATPRVDDNELSILFARAIMAAPGAAQPIWSAAVDDLVCMLEEESYFSDGRHLLDFQDRLRRHLLGEKWKSARAADKRFTQQVLQRWKTKTVRADYLDELALRSEDRLAYIEDRLEPAGSEITSQWQTAISAALSKIASSIESRGGHLLDAFRHRRQ